MKKHNANMIIYGNYVSKSCTNTSLDEYCINYIISEKYYWDKFQSKTNQNDYKTSNFNELIVGKYQGLIDFIVFVMSGHTNYNNGNFRNALIDYKRIERLLVPENYPIYLNIGYCYKELGDYNSAKFYANKLIKIDAKQWKAYYLRAVAHLELFEFDSCYADCIFLQKFKEPNVINGVSQILTTYFLYKPDYDSLIYYYEFLPEKDKNDIVKLIVSDIYFNKGNPQKTIELTTEIINSKSDLVKYALISRALANYKIGNMKLAINDLEYDISQNPKHFLAYYFKGLIYFNNNDYTNSIKELKKCLELDSLDCDTYFQLAQNYRALNDIKNESNMLNKASLIDCKKGNVPSKSLNVIDFQVIN